MPLQAVALKKYRCGTSPVSKTSDNEHTTAALGHSEVLSVENAVGEPIRATQAAWWEANHEKMTANRVAWRAANPEKAKAWWAANPEKVKAKNAAWAKANPEAVRIKQHNHRARKRANGGVLSKGLSAKLFNLQKGKCPCCKQPLGDDYHMDHKMPLALGGSNTDDNMQLLRKRCNLQKNAKDPIQFMQERGFLL